MPLDWGRAMSTLQTDRNDIELLLAAGFRIEGPSDEDGTFWWTLYRNGWSGIECGEPCATVDEAWADAARALREDEDLDWEHLCVREEVRSQFPPGFEYLMVRATARDR